MVMHFPWAFLRSQLCACEKRIKDNISNFQSAGRVISVSRQERPMISAAIAALVTFRGNHNYESLIETCKNWWEALI